MRQPMHFFGLFGVLFLTVGFGISLYLAYIKLFMGAHLGNRPLLFLGILLIMVGVQFFSIGFLGELINKDFMGKDKPEDRKSTRLNSSHVAISYAVFCLKKKNETR